MDDVTPAAEDLTADAIAVAAQQPLKGEIDGQSATAHSIPDQIAAARYRAAQSALASGGTGWGGVRIARVAPPGATG